MITFIKNNKYYFPLIFFFLFFCLGISIYNDYGISIDEDNTRINGFVGLKYIFDVFGINYTSLIESFPNIDDYPEKGIGYVFDVPAAYLEYIFKIIDSRDFFLIRHLITFLFFFLSVIFFYKLLFRRFNSILLSTLGCLFIIISPRIFAHSFFNNKDIVFMSLFVIAVYYSIELLKNLNFKNTLLASFFIGLAIGIRVLGIMLPLVLIFFLFIKFLRNENKNKIKNVILCLFFLFPFFIIILYPFLWSNPISNFLFIFERLANHEVGIHNFYLGEYIKATNIPWHYTIVWIFTTTPILYLMLFVVGFFLTLKRITFRLFNIDEKKNYNDLWRGDNEMSDLFLIIMIILPILTTILINSSLYSGWRHFFFVYPFIIFFGVRALNTFIILNKKKFSILLILLITVMIAPNILWMIKNHPHQYVYFNYIVKRNFDKLFELDYWGLSINEHLKYLSTLQDNEITISNIGNMDLELNKSFLNSKDRYKFKIIGNKMNADYIITSNIYWNGIKSNDIKLIEKNYIKIYEITIDGKSISKTYKKK